MANGKQEFVTLAVVKESLDVQARSYKSTFEILFKELKEDVSSLHKEVTKLKSSLTFSQGDIDQPKKKANKLDKRLLEEFQLIDEYREDINCLEDQNEYLESQSGRNNIKILGVHEDKDKEKTWDDTEIIVKDLIKKKLNYEDEIQIEQAHHVGQKHRLGHQDVSGKPLFSLLLPKYRTGKSKKPYSETLKK